MGKWKQRLAVITAGVIGIMGVPTSAITTNGCLLHSPVLRKAFCGK